MIYKVSPFSANGSVDSVPSKSFAHRIIILSCLSKGKTIVKNVGYSDDIKATCSCMQALGAKIDRDGNNLKIFGIENLPKKVFLDFNESGSTMRFLLPIVCALGVETEWTGRGKLLTRPNTALYNSLIEKGVKINQNKISGKLTNGQYVIDQSVSSQFISGLILALPLLKEKSTIKLVGSKVSSHYVDITLKIASEFGLKYKVTDDTIDIISTKGFISCGEYVVEGDWSGAAFPLALGVLSGKVAISNLNVDSLQGDREIVNVIQQMGGKITIKDNFIIAEKSQLNGVTLSVEQIPDLAPVIASLMAYAKGESIMLNVDRLKIKESDRLNAIIHNLTLAGIKTEYKDNSLKIFGGEPKGAEFIGFNDHRIVMSACVLSCMAKGNSKISDVEAVNKSYPEFFTHYNNLGGIFNVHI